MFAQVGLMKFILKVMIAVFVFVCPLFAGGVHFYGTILKVWEVENSLLLQVTPNERASQAILSELAINHGVSDCQFYQFEIMRNWQEAPWVEKEPWAAWTLPIMKLFGYQSQDWLAPHREALHRSVTDQDAVSISFIAEAGWLDQVAECEFLTQQTDMTFSLLAKDIIILGY